MRSLRCSSLRPDSGHLDRPISRRRFSAVALARVVSPAMVGRDEELSIVEDALLSALRGDGGAVVVGGEAGVGKSRLVHELTRRALRLGCTVMSGVCSEAELSLPYLPFLEAIGNHLSTHDIAALRARLGQAHLIELTPLRAEAVKDMVVSIFDEPDVSDEFRDFLHQRSEGNPFVLEELLRDAIDRGDIFKTDKGWDRKAIHEIRMPRTVRDTILVRVGGLSPDHVEILSAASAIGQSFDLATLTAVTGRSSAAVLSALEASVTNQLLEEADRTSGRYVFRHALTREAVYEDIIVPRRQQLHARIAEVLESQPGWKAVDLAHHLLMAGNYQQPLGMCVAAAEAAIAARAYKDAAELFERATPHVTDAVERGRLMCRAADALWLNFEPSAARPLLEQGVKDLEAAGLKVEAAGHRLLLGRCIWEMLRPDLAREQFEQAKDVLEAAGPSEALAVAYIRLSGLELFDKSGDSGLAAAERAAEVARPPGSRM